MTDAAYKDFLNPKSMLTPGIAGSLTMFLTASLAANFDLPPNWTGLTISFAFGLLVFASATQRWWQRATYYVLNSLFIFSVALGTNQVGVQTAKGNSIASHTLAADPALAMSDSTKAVYFTNWLDGTVTKRKELRHTINEMDRASLAIANMHREAREPKSDAVAESLTARRALLHQAAIIRSAEEADELRKQVLWREQPVGTAPDAPAATTDELGTDPEPRGP